MSAGDKILSGLRDALAFCRGDYSKGRVHHIALAAAARSGETNEDLARSEGPQSGHDSGNAQPPSVRN